MSSLPSQIYEFGEFRLDADKRLLTNGNGEPVSVTPRVFDTLLYLVRNSGKVIGKDELMREIWTDTIVEENNLSQNISILRRILGEKVGEGRYIATVPGRGFRFVPEVREVAETSATDADLSEEERNAQEAAGEAVGFAPTLPEPENTPLQASGSPTKSVKFAIIAALFIVALGSVGLYIWRSSSQELNAAPIRSIAILPFKPLVAGNRDEVMEMGMADTLISRLGDNPEIVVRPLSSVRKFGDLEQDAVAAGKALDVEAVLDGSIQRWGEDIRINARLIKVADGSVLWTGTFDEKFAGIFAVQDAISNRVASALALRLGHDQMTRLNKHHTENLEAYQLYLTGRFHVFKLTPQEVQKGISYFEQAIAIDERYALAYSGLADAYRSLALGTEMQPTDTLTKAKAAAQRAVDLDESLSEAHAALGMTIFWGDWDWRQAEDQFKQALKLDPNSANAHLFYAHLLSNLGRHSEALAEIKLARQLDPLFPFAGALEGQFLAFAGRPDEALERLRDTSEREPNFWMPHLIASGILIDKGMYAEAIESARVARKLAPAQTVSVAFECIALTRLGRVDEVRDALDELHKLSKERFVPPFHFALIYAALDDKDKAFEWLERGFAQRDPKMTFLKVQPKLNSLPSDPRFTDLAKRMNLQ